MARLAEALDAPHAFSPFNKSLEKYRRLRNKLDQSDASPEVAGAIAAATGRAGVRLARRLPAAGVAFDYLDEEDVATYASEVAAYVVRRFGDRDEADLLLHPIERLTPLFIDGISALMEQSAVTLFFDTFEETDHLIEPWLLALIEGAYGAFPRNILFVIGGRHRLPSNTWAPLESILRFIDLEPVAEPDVREYLSRKGIRSADQVDDIVRLAKGVPIHFVSLSIGDPMDPQAADTVVDRVLRSVPDAIREAAIRAAFPRSFNRDLAPRFLEDASVVDGLVALPFVQASTDGWTYHSVIRAEFLDHGWRESPETCAAIHVDLATYHLEHARTEGDRANHSAATRHAREALYHQASTEYAAVLKSAVSRAIRVWNINVKQARPFVGALRDAEVDRQMGDDRAWGRKFVAAVDAFESGHGQPGRELISRALDEDLLLDDAARAAAYEARSDLQSRRGLVTAALEDIDAAIELEPNNWQLFYSRALISLNSDQDERALEDCERALASIPQDAPQIGMLNVLFVRIAMELFAAADALELIDAALDAEQHPYGFLIRGQIRRATGDFDGSLDDFMQVLTLDPQREHEVRKERGLTYRKAALLDQAEVEIRRAIEVEPKCDHCWRQLVRVLAEDSEEDEVAEQLEETAPNVKGVRVYRGGALLSLGATDRAVEELRKAVDEDPANPGSRVRLAEALLVADDIDGALLEIEAALTLQLEWPEALATRGIIKYRRGQFAEAEKDWALSEELSGGTLIAVNPDERGLCLAKLGKFADAVKQYEAALDQDRDAVTLYNYAIAYTHLFGRAAAASVIAEAEEALDAVEVPRIVMSYGRAGLAAVLLHDKQAQEGLRAALEVDKDLVKSWLPTDPAWLAYRDCDWFNDINKLGSPDDDGQRDGSDRDHS